jgi:hypothetical protein
VAEILRRAEIMQSQLQADHRLVTSNILLLLLLLLLLLFYLTIIIVYFIYSSVKILQRIAEQEK